MTWNFLVAGCDKEKVKKKIRARERMPESFREAICAVLDTMPAGQRPFTVESSGHLDANGGNVRLNIRTMETYIAD